MTAPSPAAAGLPLEDVERVARVLLRAILGDTDGGLVLDGDLPAAEVARLIREEAAAAALAEMRPTAAVPDPRFRDQLAEALLRGSGGRQYWDPEELRDIVDDLLPLIAAEVEARVQAAANQRAAEADSALCRFGRALSEIDPDALTFDGARVNRIALDAHADLARAVWGPSAAAIASPAPVPPDANGGERR